MWETLSPHTNSGQYYRFLKLESFWLLPGEVLVGEMPILCSLEVDGSRQVKLLDNDTWSQIEIFVDDLDELVRGSIGSAVCVDEDGERFRNTDGIGELNKRTAGKLGMNQ